MKKARNLSLLDDAGTIDLTGIIEKIIFHNSGNGFSVLKLYEVTESHGAESRKVADTRIAVGTMLGPREGMKLALHGKYVQNAKFGRQLAFTAYEEVMPTGEKEIASYLGSGIIKGIGPATAQKIVDKYGKDTLKILDENPAALLEISGVSKKKLEGIMESWQNTRDMRDLMLFLQPHGISNAYAARIYSAYEQEAKTIVKENPYRLAMDIRGIGFQTADSIAMRLGFGAEHPLRAQSAILYLLQKASDEGHVFLPRGELLAQMEKNMGILEETSDKAIAALARLDRIVSEILEQENGEKIDAVYLKRFHVCEEKTSFYMQRLLRSPKTAHFENPEEFVRKITAKQDIVLAPQQLDAVHKTAKHKMLVITGGPGTGKTTIIKTIIQLFSEIRAKILLAAPTGRAAKRMTETCGLEAKTIHRLLEYSPKDDRFLRNEDSPLACHLLIIDEASMMDTLLFYYLLKAVPLGATVVLVGDVSQLPSVGPGNVLSDIIESGAVPVVRLTEIFRQAAESSIIKNAHLINNGQMPLLEGNSGRMTDFYFIPRDEPEEAADLIIDLISRRLPGHFNLDPINDIQFLTPMRKGSVGAENMNMRLQQALNPNGYEIRRGDRAFRMHDKVMQVRNNYDKDIYNGDIGRVCFISVKEKTLKVDFDGVVISYDFEDLDELVPAYAISIHKSQGSEYPAVVIPLTMQHFVLLQRNLIYTGITRAKRLVVLVGENKALSVAIRNNRTSRRFTWLAKRLIMPEI